MAVEGRGVPAPGRRVWLAAGATEVELGPGGDPDWLLTRRDCQIIKLQRKVTVGRIATPRGVVYIKRHNVFAWRIALGSIGTRSPARRAFRAAEAVASRGFETPRIIAAVEVRRLGILRRSFLLTHEVPAARRADECWAEILDTPAGAARGKARRTFARSLGTLLASLHAAGVYHGDIKDYNLLVRGPAAEPQWVLLDLDGVRIGSVSARRRTKNLMQLERTLGRRATAADRLRVVDAYLAHRGESSTSARRQLTEAIRLAAARKDRGRPPRGGPESPSPHPTVSCTIVCQNEGEQIARCLESVAWCDEIVIVDGGSCDDTLAIARRFTDRIAQQPWPGYRAQKQFALEQARGEWVLNVDADERVSPELASEIRAALATAGPDVGGFAIPRLVGFLGRWWYQGGWYPRRIVRVMRRTTTTWGGRDPHERALASGRIVRLRAPILHHSYENIADHLRSIGKLTAVSIEQPRTKQGIGAGRLLLEPAWRFLRFYVLRRGALAGIAGLYAAAADSFYVFLRWAALWRRGTRASLGEHRRGR